jgi:hypothetical protein
MKRIAMVFLILFVTQTLPAQEWARAALEK